MNEYKSDNGIVDVRVDDRMIHGIVATEWIPSKNTNRAMVVNEAASVSDMLRSTLKMATPAGVALSVLAPQKAAENLLNGNYKAQRVFVIARGIEDVYELYKAGVELKRVNLGNVTQNLEDGITVLDKTVRVSKKEMELLAEMLNAGILITAQFRVSDSVKNLEELIRG